MPLAGGDQFAGFTVQRLLGAGGMGEVHLVQHPRVPRFEALKILPANLTDDVYQTVTKGTEAPSTTASTLRVTLQKINGDWLISKFEPI